MAETRNMLAGVHTIAVVGFSTQPEKPAYAVAAYLHAAGYRILPVNPAIAEAWGERAYDRLPEIAEPVDLVLVFRRPEHCPAIVRDALAMPHRPRIIWLQSGIVSPEAAAIAREAGITFVQDRCLMVAHRRAFGEG